MSKLVKESIITILKNTITEWFKPATKWVLNPKPVYDVLEIKNLKILLLPKNYIKAIYLAFLVGDVYYKVFNYYLVILI